MGEYPNEINGKNVEGVLSRLRAPFLDDEVDWRVDRVFSGNSYGPAQAVLLAYVDQRAVLDRLDSVLGPHNWQSSTRRFNGGCDVGIGIKIKKEWVWKWDGAGQRKMHGDGHHEAKTSVSDGVKRAGMQWGMGRHLYDLPNTKVPVLERKPQGVPPNRIVRVNSRSPEIKGWAVAPSVRELQNHLLTIDNLVGDIPDPKARRLARVEAVRIRMGWLHPSQVPHDQVPDILSAFEAASAVWEEDRPVREGRLKPSECGTEQLKVASHRLARWCEGATLIDQMRIYFEWKMAGGSAGVDPEGPSANPQQPPQQTQGGQPQNQPQNSKTQGGETDPWS